MNLTKAMPSFCSLEMEIDRMEPIIVLRANQGSFHDSIKNMSVVFVTCILVIRKVTQPLGNCLYIKSWSLNWEVELALEFSTRSSEVRKKWALII